MKKLPLLLLPLLSGAFVLQGEDVIIVPAVNGVAAVAQVDTVTITGGSATDTFSVTVDGNALAAVAFNTDLATTATDLAAAINADATIGALVTADASAADGSLTLTAATAGTGFTASSTANDVSTNGVAASTHANTTANVVMVAPVAAVYGPAEGEGEEEEVDNRTPVVENVTAGQVAGTKTMEIFYDLKVSDGHPCTVTVKWSTDNGDTYPLTATAVVGDAGPGVEPGPGLSVTWDMGVDWNDKFTQEGRIKVIASRIPHDYVPGGGSETGGHSETGK